MAQLIQRESFTLWIWQETNYFCKAYGMLTKKEEKIANLISSSESILHMKRASKWEREA